MDRLVNRQRQCRRELREAWLSVRGLADSVTHWQCKRSWTGFYLIRAVVSYLFQLIRTLSVYGFRPVMQFSGYFHCLAVHVRAALAGSVCTFRGYGHYWSSSAYNATNAWYLWFNGSGANLNNNNRANGFSVRCVAQNLRLSLLCSFLRVKTYLDWLLKGFGHYWSSSASSVAFAWILYFNGDASVLAGSYQACGFSVRCVAQNLRLSLLCSFLSVRTKVRSYLEGCGFYWSSSASTATDAWRLGFNASGAYLSHSNRVDGFSVRCVAQNLQLSLLCSFLCAKMYTCRFLKGYGNYWSSSVSNAVTVWCLLFNESIAYLDGYGHGRAHSFSVRCVAQNLRLSLLCSFPEVWFDRFFSVGAGRFCLQAAGARNQVIDK